MLRLTHQLTKITQHTRTQWQAEHIKTTEEEEKEEEEGEERSWGCPESNVPPPWDDSGLLLSQLLFLSTWKSDVATNPKSLSCTDSELLALALPFSSFLLTTKKHKHTPFIFILLQQQKCY